MSEDAIYEMTLSLNVLNHLGLNLYSNTAAVLSEVVANGWDADAEHVDIDIDSERKEISISDDGHGMTREEVNHRFLNVGYRRRDELGGAVTPRFGREVMGRKGIGKLSLFSVADVVEVQTVKAGERNGLRLVLPDIQSLIENGQEGTYRPEALPQAAVMIGQGTRLVLSDLRKGLQQVERALRRRLARRFSIIGERWNFQVQVNGEPITVSDRDYFHKLQYVWWYGDSADLYKGHCKNLSRDVQRDSAVTDTFSVSGWIGTVDQSGTLKDEYENLNKIILLARGKLVQEDILEDFGEGGMYTKYLIGEVNADFLDLDYRDDIATSSRQRIIEDDPRYRDLSAFLRRELKNIEGAWTGWRNEEGVARALMVPAIKEWFGTLGPDHRRRAQSLFGRINRLTLENEADRTALFQHSVLAFESLRYRETLDRLEDVSESDLVPFLAAVANLDDIEAGLYHRIVSERIQVIERLKAVVDEDALEKVVQELLFDHLWLLDTGWERATETAYMEQEVKRAFDDLDAKLTEEESNGRVDIRYKKTAGVNVIVELKRASRVVSSLEIIEQVDKYRTALKKLLRASGAEHEPIEVVCVVGRDLRDWEAEDGRTESMKVLEAKRIRVVTYQSLLENAYRQYDAFLKNREDVGRIQKLIQAIEAPLLEEDGGSAGTELPSEPDASGSGTN